MVERWKKPPHLRNEKFGWFDFSATFLAPSQLSMDIACRSKFCVLNETTCENGERNARKK